MSNWERISLENLCEFIDGDRGKNYPKASEFSDIGFCMFLNAGNVTSEGFRFKNCSFISEEKDLVLKKGKMKKYDIVLTTRGTIGNVAFWGDNIPFKDIRINSGMVILRFTSNNISRYFIYKMLSSNFAQELYSLFASGSAQPQLPIKDLKRIQLNIPDLPTQQKIADILSTYDDLIENNNRRIELLEKSAQELYKEWFVRFRFPDYENTKFVNGLPEGWEVVSIGDVFHTSSGGTPSRAQPEFYVNGIYDWIKTGELGNKFVFDTEEKITEVALQSSSAKLFPERSLILAMYGATIGKMGFSTKPSTCNQACCVFEVKNSLSLSYLYFWLSYNLDFIIGIGFGAAQQNLSQELIKKVKILKPTENISSSFSEYVDATLDGIHSLMKKNNNLKKQRDLLLPRLMSGKLELEV